MSRVALYGPVHKALRHAGTRALVQVGACAGDLALVARALTSVRELLEMHETHQRVEDEVIMPAIEARRPGASVRLADAHVDHASGIAALRELVGVIETGEATPVILRRLYLELSRFLAEDLLHMYEEETLAEPLLEEIYSQPELAALVARAQSRLAASERELLAASMLAALSVIERQELGAKAG